MRYRVRIQPYVAPEVQRKLRSYAGSRGLTESAVTEAALVDYVDRDQAEQALVVRRLDAMGQAVGEVRRDMNVLLQALRFLVRFTFYIVPEEPKDPKARAAASQKSDDLYARFVTTIAAELRRGPSLVSDILGGGAPATPVTVGSKPTGGR
jgi:predicted transcriptional regulator